MCKEKDKSNSCEPCEPQLHRRLHQDGDQISSLLATTLEPNNKGRKEHNPLTVAIGYLFKVGFNKTCDRIESLIKDDETLKKHCTSLRGHSVIKRGMKQLAITYIRKMMNQVTRFLRRKKMIIAVDCTGIITISISTWYEFRIERHGNNGTASNSISASI